MHRDWKEVRVSLSTPKVLRATQKDCMAMARAQLCLAWRSLFMAKGARMSAIHPTRSLPNTVPHVLEPNTTSFAPHERSVSFVIGLWS